MHENTQDKANFSEAGHTPRNKLPPLSHQLARMKEPLRPIRLTREQGGVILPLRPAKGQVIYQVHRHNQALVHIASTGVFRHGQIN